jgi:hypothetical protein
VCLLLQYLLGQVVECGRRGVEGACLGSETCKTSHGSRVHENEVGVCAGVGSEIVTAVEGLDALTRIADMTPWLRELSRSELMSAFVYALACSPTLLPLQPRLH